MNSEEFDAIVNPPEAAFWRRGGLLSPVRGEWRTGGAPTLRLTLTVDHRVADGVLAAGFLNAVAKVIERLVLLLV